MQAWDLTYVVCHWCRARIWGPDSGAVDAPVEYQGQKCSACSRVYVSESVWPDFKKAIIEQTKNLRVGGPEKADNFVQAIIHERAFDRLHKVIEDAKSDPEFELLVGGKASKEKGCFVHPTIYQTTNPNHDIMERELFRPIFVVYAYKDADYEKTLKPMDSTSSYGLIGSIFATDPEVSLKTQSALKHAAGNLYLNTKCTGSVVGQQPFGGNRDSGTNDKTGSIGLIGKFTSIRTIKEDFEPLTEVHYPSNEV